MPAESTPTPPAPSIATRMMRPINTVVERFIPSALVFALILTFIVMIVALIATDSGPQDIVLAWGDGLAGLLAFMTQMALILMLGHILAHTRPARRLLRSLGAMPKGRVAPYVFVSVITCLSALITWGLSLVVGALLSKEVASASRRRGEPVHFPLLVAAGYGGLAVWHMGYSGSAPLTAATEGSFLQEYLPNPLPVSETIFAPWNLAAVAASVLVIAVTIALLAPKQTDPITEMPEAGDEAHEEWQRPTLQTLADRLDAARLLTLVPGGLLLVYLVLHYANGGQLTLDIVNWTFLTLILLLVGSPAELIDLTRQAASNVGEILLQFPLYAGIMGIMAGTGLITILSEWLVSISSPTTFGLFALLSAGIVNFFVPSGGGQVAVQGPILLEAAADLGVDPSIAIMALSYGDQWTNMIQPFWALPLLAIAGLKLRDILGYTTVVMLTVGVVFAVTLLLVST